MLQVCPHDAPPFKALCRAYARSAELAGGRLHTVFLAPPDDQPDPGAHYLNLSRLDRNRVNRRALRLAVDDLLQTQGIGELDAVICHRYRAFQAARGLSVPDRLQVVVAHEFGMFKRWRRRLYRRVCARRVHFAGVSRAVNEELAAETGFGMLLPNILDLTEYDAIRLSRSAARKALNLPKDKFLIGVVGRLHYKKRPQLALEAYRAFAANELDVELVFIGDGDRDLRTALNQPGVNLCGQVDQAHRYFLAFDVLLHTGRVESFGMVILEAMAAGVPVVAAGEGPRYVLGGTGFMAARDTAEGYAEALRAAYIADRQAVGRTMRERVETRFTPEVFARSLHNLGRFLHDPTTEFQKQTPPEDF